jgi:DMSO/TMAO reductase YedYZ molybdopterin-dependent catalytic subunit
MVAFLSLTMRHLNLTIGGLVNEPKTLTLADLQDPQKFEPTELTVTLQVNHFKNFSNVIY